MDFSAELVQWYQKNKRALPWRDTANAYVIWLSEIILQQTRVEQGMPYFYRFLEKYPDVISFAAAHEDEILKLWQGLGYYSRGRNMLKTARQVVGQYGGEFPVAYTELIKLKGIGGYTAAAISSFSSDEPRAVVDGNVYRVLARYFGIEEPINSNKGKKLFQQVADEVLDKDHAGLHNQAVMEFGAMLCKPKNPDCAVCPLRNGCYALQHNKVSILPQKLKTVKIRERFFNYFLITDGDTLLMNKRGEEDIWANMYDLPLIETAGYLTPQEIMNMPATAAAFGKNIVMVGASRPKKHILTHQHIHAQFIQIEPAGGEIKYQSGWLRTGIKNLKNMAMPKIIFLFLNNFFNL
ncbi:A/G-specific adenine glycosylase [Mucilaginibacter ginsenosidivorans]|uniref:Adenine DNA glycosylase n=1 Tax=Mucilaginibacter ginsenosidivorans TaxID=398053 RepID=A0A5B8UR45_9SPHI|nr:A/G-specific adenine glycosylase [Mucilaginibacter ginsenosidivorans]QEC61504.1 A/G-specific adenine glycosylase [Mucilaginibacter ginsenosidivorans]